MNSQVNRSFSPFQESDESGIDYDYWFRLLSRSRFLWSDLLKKRLVVILGEAGIGKTFEFQNEAKTLAGENQAAFFLPLNQLDTPGGFEQALIDERDRYESWVKSEQPGNFFLDAVDEARLTSPIALQKALVHIHQTLAPHTLLSVCETCRIRGLGFLEFLRSGERDIDAFATKRLRNRHP